MFELGSQLLEKLKSSLTPDWEPAVAGPQIQYACTQCSASCTQNCTWSCKGSCKGGCTRSCKGNSR